MLSYGMCYDDEWFGLGETAKKGPHNSAIILYIAWKTKNFPSDQATEARVRGVKAQIVALVQFLGCGSKRDSSLGSFSGRRAKMEVKGGKCG